MKLLFVHDHIFRKVGNEYYSTGGLNDDVINRYSKYVDKISIIARVIEVDYAEGRWSKIENPKVKIYGSISFNNARLGFELESCDKMIVRLPSFLGLKALDMNRKVNKPYLIEMVGCAWDSLWNHGIKGKIVAPYVFIKNKIEAKKAPYILYVTDQFLQKRYHSNGKQIGCSDVVLQEISDEILKKRVQKIQHLNYNRVIIGTTAAVNVTYKGQQYVIEALGKLKLEGNTSFEYQLVGNGNQSFLKSIAEKYDVSDQVVFLGGISHDKVFDWLDTIDIYVQPSRQEGLPRALVEAMSRGLPAFGARTGGITELLDEEFVFSNSFKNIDEIAEILKKCNKNVMLEQANRSFAIAKEYQKDKLEDKRDRFYRDFFISTDR